MRERTRHRRNIKLKALLIVLALHHNHASAIAAPVAFVSPEPPEKAVPSNTITISILDDHNVQLQPMAVAVIDKDLYFLDIQKLWRVPDGARKLAAGEALIASSCGPTHPNIGNIPVQEFSNFVFSKERQALEVLDKSGDIFEFLPVDKTWHLLRPNHPLGSPDPEYIDLTCAGDNVCLLDPERNQIWRYPAVDAKFFKDILPWRTKPGDVNLGDTLSLVNDGNTWVLRKNGTILKFSTPPAGALAQPLPFRWARLKNMRPSRLLTDSGTPLYLVERENNRVIAINKQNGSAKQFIFGDNADLRGLIPQKDGFWIINGSTLEHRLLNHADDNHSKLTPRRLDPRLSDLAMPIKGAALPRHPGVWPGARRLYRYGIHKGTDYFHDPGTGTIIEMGTPVLAAGGGKVIRADRNFKDMNATKYGYIIYQCHRQHITTESSEDLLRGCQVWLDHGNGLITKYAHLDKIKPGLKTGMQIKPGDLIGFVGVSGTGENLHGRIKHPHLHFEVWLDDKYLGWGLTPAETIGLYEDIFVKTAKRGAHEQSDR